MILHSPKEKSQNKNSDNDLKHLTLLTQLLPVIKNALVTDNKEQYQEEEKFKSAGPFRLKPEEEWHLKYVGNKFINENGNAY